MNAYFSFRRSTNMSQINLIYTPAKHFFNDHFESILYFIRTFYKLLHPSWFLTNRVKQLVQV
jgi:hypothetical protein